MVRKLLAFLVVLKGRELNKRFGDWKPDMKSNPHIGIRVMDKHFGAFEGTEIIDPASKR